VSSDDRNGRPTLRIRPLNVVAVGGEAALAGLTRSLKGARLTSAVAQSGGLAAIAIRESADVAILACPEARTPSRVEELRQRLEAAAIKLPIVIVLPSANCRDARKLIDAGAAGIVAEEELLETLEPTLRAACAGQVVYPRRLRTAAERPTLSYREKQVLGLATMGLTNREIAGRLWVAESTVKSHLSTAFGKLGVRSRSEAAALILDPNESLGANILAIAGMDRPTRNGAGTAA
jgi:DNA-binding NarL/FixJ family response regulator